MHHEFFTDLHTDLQLCKNKQNKTNKKALAFSFSIFLCEVNDLHRPTLTVWILYMYIIHKLHITNVVNV